MIYPQNQLSTEASGQGNFRSVPDLINYGDCINLYFFLSNYFHLNLVTNQSGKPSYVPKCRDATSWCISRITCTPCWSKFLTMVFSFCKYSRSKYPSWGSIPDHIAPSLTTLSPQLARSWAYLSSSRAAWYQGGCLATKLTPWNILILPLKITEISDVCFQKWISYCWSTSWWDSGLTDILSLIFGRIFLSSQAACEKTVSKEIIETIQFLAFSANIEKR